MTTYTNQTKNTSTFTNQSRGKSANPPTYADMPIPYSEAEGSYADPKDVWVKQTKNTATFTNQTKS